MEQPQQPQQPGTPPPGAPLIGTPPASMPQVPQLTPGQHGGGTGRDPKDAFQDPNAKHYRVELLIGAGVQPFNFACPSDISAALGAFFLALQHQPHVHTFGVWRKKGPEVDAQLEETVCFVTLAQMMASCAPTIQNMTGSQQTTPQASIPPAAPGVQSYRSPAVPVVTPEAGLDELNKQLKDQRRRPS